MRWTALYAQKNIGLHALAKHAGTTTDELCARYNGQKLENGLDKGELFKNSLSGSYNAKQVIYLYTTCNLPHHKDTRTPVQYATDLIIGWLSEDAIITALNNRGCFATGIGTDRERNFLKDDQITHLADIETPTQLIEVVFDYTNHWVTHNKLDLRDNKMSIAATNGTLSLPSGPVKNPSPSPSTSEGFTSRATPITRPYTFTEEISDKRITPHYHTKKTPLYNNHPRC